MLRCPACLNLNYANYDDLAKHILEIEKNSNAEHIMWLNRNVSSKKLSHAELSEELEEFFQADRVKEWVISAMIKKFFSAPYSFRFVFAINSRECIAVIPS